MSPIRPEKVRSVRSKLFANPNVLEEMTSISFHNESQVLEKERVKNYISEWILRAQNSEGKNSVIAAYIGPFGSGKSTILSSIRDETIDEYTWLQFDTRRYSDRRQIWDGFVIETIGAIRLGNGARTVKLSEIAAWIDGNRLHGPYEWLHNHPLINFSLIFASWLVISGLAWLYFRDPNYPLQVFAKSVLKYGVGALFILLAFFGLDMILPKPERPLSRIFDLESELSRSLIKLERPLIIVIEDCDRAGEESLVFMETLQQFLSNNSSKATCPQPVIIIAPQDITYFDLIRHPGLDGVERMIKIYDTNIYSAMSALGDEQVQDLLDSLQIHSKFDAKLRSIVMSFIGRYRVQLNIRKVKYILREVNHFIDAYPSADPAIALIFIFANFIVTEEFNNRQLLSRNIRDGGSISVKDGDASRSIPLGLLFSDYIENPSESQQIQNIMIRFRAQAIEVANEPLISSDGVVQNGRYILSFDIKYTTLLH